MSVDKTRQQRAYGLDQPLVGVPRPPIVVDRNPNENDKAALGQLWVNPAAFTAYILVAVVDNEAIWAAYPSLVDDNWTVGGTVTAGTGFVAVNGGAQIAGNSSIAGDLVVSDDMEITQGNLDIIAGNLSANVIQTNSDAAKLIGMYEDSIVAGGTDTDVDITLSPKGYGAFEIDSLSGAAAYRTLQSSIQTVDATETILYTIDLAVESALQVKARINGLKSTGDHTVGGEILINAMRAAGGDIEVVGSKVITFWADDTATAGIAIDAGVHTLTNTLRIYVTGAVGETWNWVTTLSYMITTTP